MWSLLNCVLGVLVCWNILRANVLDILVCLTCSSAYVLPYLTCSCACVFSHVCLLCPYVLKCLTCLLFSNIYVLTCLCAWYPQMSCLLYIWKVNFQKFLCRIIWLLFGGVFRTQFYDSAFAKKIDDKKPLSVFPDNHRYLPGL